MRIKLGTTADGFDNWSLDVEVPDGTSAAELKDILKGPPYSLPDLGSTRLLKKAGGALLSLGNTDKVTKQVVLLNFEPPGAAKAGPPATQPQAPQRPESQPQPQSLQRIVVRTSAEGYKNWQVELEIPSQTTMVGLVQILSGPPFSLGLPPNTKAFYKNAVGSLTYLRDFDSLPQEVVLDGVRPPAMSPEKIMAQGSQRQQIGQGGRMLTEEEKHGVMASFHGQKQGHENLSSVERRFRSWARSIAFAISSLQVEGLLRRGTLDKPLLIWIIGATEEVEGGLAKFGIWTDANMFDRQPCEVVLIGENLGAYANSVQIAEGTPARVRCQSSKTLSTMWDFKAPDLNAVFYSETARSPLTIFEQSLPKATRARMMNLLSQYTIFTYRSKLSKEGLESFEKPDIRDKMIKTATRNPFSSLKGEEHVVYDDNGWYHICKGLETIHEVAKLHVQDNERPYFYNDSLARKNAIFWGIIDLKYDPSKSILDRVKVLETGDGRSSRFSHAGAEIPKRFKDKYKLDEAHANCGKHTVVSANKKLTHDLLEQYGYGYLVPKQVCCPRLYTPTLAEEIIRGLGIPLEELVVLKLCNRSRAAGVIPVPASDLDGVLKELLKPPAQFEASCKQKLSEGIIKTMDIDWGCYEEQLRHWWSNECTHFVAENYATSMLTVKDGKEYDGTMRVAFAIHQKKKPKGSQQTVKYDNPLIEYSPPAEELEIDWIGGYWKLPKEDVESINIRASVISAARTAGTAHVALEHLHEIYAAMGDSVQQLFGGPEPSPQWLTEKYSEQPELATYLTARLAISMKDLSRVRMGLKLASSAVEKAQEGPTKRCAESFLFRGYGILEAMTPPYKWVEARECFAESVEMLPTNAASLYLLGMSELELGNVVGATDFMEKSLFLDLDFKAPYVNLGICYLRTGKFDEAIAVSEALLKRHPDSPQCHYHIGVACYQKSFLLQTSTKATAAQEMDSLRKRALDELSESRESEEGQRLTMRGIRGGPGKVDSPWLDADDAMCDALRKYRVGQTGARVPKVDLPNTVGWKFYGWRN